MTEILLETRHLFKHFGGIYATEDINLQIESGRTVGKIIVSNK